MKIEWFKWTEGLSPSMFIILFGVIAFLGILIDSDLLFILGVMGSFFTIVGTMLFGGYVYLKQEKLREEGKLKDEDEEEDCPIV